MVTREEILEQFEYSDSLGCLIRRSSGVVAKIRKNGYRVVKLKNKPYPEHRLIWCLFNGSFPPKGLDIDHINHNRSDNRISNLRLLTRSQNCCNREVKKSLGIDYRAKYRKWRARIQHEGKEVFLGYFETEPEAQAAYLTAKRVFHKEFYHE